MSNLVFDLAQEELLCVLKPYQVEIMRFLWETGKPQISRAVHSHIKTAGVEGAKSRASIINFLNDMVDEGFLDYEEESGKGGYHRVYSLSDKSATEGIFRKTIYDMFLENLIKFSIG